LLLGFGQNQEAVERWLFRILPVGIIMTQGVDVVKICERWLNSFVLFLADMGSRPSKYHTIDRINNDDDYRPGNCR